MTAKEKFFKRLEELEALRRQRTEIQDRLKAAQDQEEELEDRVAELVADGVLRTGSLGGGKLANAQRKLEKARDEIKACQLAMKSLDSREEKLQDEIKKLRDAYLRGVLKDLQDLAVKHGKEVERLAQDYARAFETFWAAWCVAHYLITTVAEAEGISYEKLVHKKLLGVFRDWGHLRMMRPTIVSLDLRDPEEALRGIGSDVQREAWKEIKKATGVDPAPFFTGVASGLGSTESPSNRHKYLAKFLGLSPSLFEDLKGDPLLY